MHSCETIINDVYTVLSTFIFFKTPSSKINSFKFVVNFFFSTITHKITCKQFDITLMYK